MKKKIKFRLPQLTRGQKVVRNLIIIAGMCFVMFAVFIGFDRSCTTVEDAMNRCLETVGISSSYEVEDFYTCSKEYADYNEYPYHYVAYIRTTQTGKQVDAVMYINGTNPSPYKVFGPKKVTYSAYIDSVEPVELTDYEAGWRYLDKKQELENASANFTYSTDAFPEKKLDGMWSNRDDSWFIRIDFDDPKYRNEQTQMRGQLFFNVYKDDMRVEWLDTSEHTTEQSSLIGEELAAKMAADLAVDFEKEWTRYREYNAFQNQWPRHFPQELVKE